MSSERIKFTDDQMIEICRARVRLEEWRNKFQPYPAYPDNPPEPQPAIIPEHRLDNNSEA